MGTSATYPTNKLWEGWQSHRCLNQMPTQQQALSLKLLICVSVECRQVEELIFFRLLHARTARFSLINMFVFRCFCILIEARLYVKCALTVHTITLRIFLYLSINYFGPFPRSLCRYMPCPICHLAGMLKVKHRLSCL